jgi:hypothetical protein
MKFLLSGLLLLAVLASGCAPAPQRMSAADRKTIQVVNINGDVAKPPAPFYLGPGGGVGLMFGAIGAIVTEPGREDGRTSLRNFVEKNGVSIERVVLEEFDAALRRSGKLLVADKAEPGAPTIKITIRQYGLSIPNGFSSKLVPILSVLCEMTDASGKVVWSAGDRVLPLGNPVEGLPAEEIRDDAKAIERAWRAVAKYISESIVREL